MATNLRISEARRKKYDPYKKKCVLYFIHSRRNTSKSVFYSFYDIFRTRFFRVICPSDLWTRLGESVFLVLRSKDRFSPMTEMDLDSSLNPHMFLRF